MDKETVWAKGQRCSGTVHKPDCISGGLQRGPRKTLLKTELWPAWAKSEVQERVLVRAEPLPRIDGFQANKEQAGRLSLSLSHNHQEKWCPWRKELWGTLYTSSKWVRWRATMLQIPYSEGGDGKESDVGHKRGACVSPGATCQKLTALDCAISESSSWQFSTCES